MAYNLPPPWDPGYALPKNVQAEGLRRRAFVTKQMPRGTYDQPRVGTGGYIVPQYVMDEGYGQGTYTTKWAPSGTYAGAAVPHWLNARPQTIADRRRASGGRQVTVRSGLSGISGEPGLPEPLESYGQRAATILMDRVTKLPQNLRKAALKTILDSVDQSLWTRTAEIARRNSRQGMPPAQALHQGLARAMGTGFGAELVTTGMRRTAPQPRSLLGLGCYGCMAALGAIARDWSTEDGGGGGEPPPATRIPPPPPPPPPMPPPASTEIINPTTHPELDPTTPPVYDTSTFCAPPVGFTWATAADGTMFLRRPRAGETLVNGPCGVTVTVSDKRIDFTVAGFPFSRDNMNRVWASSDSGDNIANIKAWPDVLITSPDQLSNDQVATLVDYLTKWNDGRPLVAGEPNTIAFNNSKYGFWRYPDGNDADADAAQADVVPWFGRLGILYETPVRKDSIIGLRTNNYPVGRYKRPDTGETFQLKLTPIDPALPWSPTNRLVLKVWLTKIPSSGGLFDTLRDLGVAIASTVLAPIEPIIVPVGKAIGTAAADAGTAVYDAAKDALNALSDLGCSVLSEPAAGAIIGGVAGAYAGSPQAGAALGVAGAAVVKGSCGDQPPAPPPPPPPAPSIMPWVLIGGAGLVAVLLFTSKKKGP